jgi:hypothetical protein
VADQLDLTLVYNGTMSTTAHDALATAPNGAPIRRVAWWALAVGVVTGMATDVGLRRHSADVRLTTEAVLLAVAAGIYPAARAGRSADKPEDARHEWLTVAGAMALAAATPWLPPAATSRLLAAGWAGHAAFDLTHHRGSASRLPAWYPQLCAAYDLALAAAIALDRSGDQPSR